MSVECFNKFDILYISSDDESDNGTLISMELSSDSESLDLSSDSGDDDKDIEQRVCRKRYLDGKLKYKFCCKFFKKYSKIYTTNTIFKNNKIIDNNINKINIPDKYQRQNTESNINV